MGSPALEVEELTVRYGKRVAVDGLSLSLAPGEIVGVLGPNGAGKSTSLLAIAGALVPASGRISISGVGLADDPLAAKRHLGFADQPPSLYDFFTVKEHLEFVGKTRGHDDIEAHEQLLNDIGLGGIGDRLCRELSFGMRQRLGLAAALLGDVRLVLLDETLNGLDPRAAKQAREAVSRAAQGGAAVLMSTHLLGVAERLCHRILIMDGGRLVLDLSGDKLTEVLDAGAGALEALYLEHVKTGDAA